MKIDGKSFDSLKVTVMGLGLHGGGLASALFFASRGARVTVTDLKTETALESTIEKLASYPIRYVLGRHADEDFIDTDLVIKNPGVDVSSRFLAIAGSHGVRIETDISLFLMFSINPVIAVTGSKGKSTTASALHAGLISVHPRAKLGGNITVSPLSFIDDLADEPVVLELSSWQLADLAGKDCLKPKVSIITNILPDHLNRYRTMDEYVADKKLIYAHQDENDVSIFNYDDPYTEEFRAESKARVLFFSETELPNHLEGCWLASDECWLRLDGESFKLLDRPLALPGRHNRLNLLAASLALAFLGLSPETITERLADFSGIEHRLEFFFQSKGIRFINDSAATIPHAVVQALKAVEGPVILITGGTDKNIDFHFAAFTTAARLPKEIILLAGSATEKMAALFKKTKIPFRGPLADLQEAVREAVRCAQAGDTILFSPGCASFGMFQNEFDRGRQYKKIVSTLGL